MKKRIVFLMLLLGAILLVGCKKEGISDIDFDKLYQTLEENGYGEGVDYSKQQLDDPGIPKEKDVTRSRDTIAQAYAKTGDIDLEPGEMYEKAWWDYIPDSYDLSQDVFPKTENYAGEEKHYNNKLEQTVVEGSVLSSGQSLDMSIVKSIANTFIYEVEKDRYVWTDDLKAVCDRADSLDIADFYSRESMRSWYAGGNKDELVAPTCLTAHYKTRVVSYDKIGIPQMSGYAFTISVWEKKDKPVGWVNELQGGTYMDENEIYENMGEWDFYDELKASSSLAKVVKPKKPNGVKISQGKDDLANEMYIYQKIAGSGGWIYYYGNGITVDMTFYGGKQGGNFKDALKYCRTICKNQ